MREADSNDAPFMLRLLNEPSWQRYIARHDIETVEDARNYLQERIIPVYESGLGFWVIELKKTNALAGICGLVKRPFLKEVDLGFALLEEFWGAGLAYDSALLAIEYARRNLSLKKLQAITVPFNTASIQLLEKLEFSLKDQITDEENEELLLYEMILEDVRNINLLNK